MLIGTVRAVGHTITDLILVNAFAVHAGCLMEIAGCIGRDVAMICKSKSGKERKREKNKESVSIL